MRANSKGFSLLELVVAAAIITIAVAWSVPNYMRSVRQGEVDRYNRAIETGFENLKENLRSTRTTCMFQFNSPTSWKRPDQLLEFKTKTSSDGVPTGIDSPERLRCCNSQLKAQTGQECPDIETIRMHPDTSDATKSLRFMWRQFTPESERVEVAVSSENYTLPPPGSNAETEPLTFMVRSIDADKDSNLKARCMRITGSGVLKRGTWQGDPSSGSCDFDERNGF